MAKKQSKTMTTTPKSRAAKAPRIVKAKSVVEAPTTIHPRTGKVIMGARGDLGQPGRVAIERLPEPQRSIARAADRMIRRTVKGCESVVKWGNCCYFKDGRAFASLIQTKKGINLALPGALLKDPSGLLEGTGRVMRHVKVHDTARATSPAVARLVSQAVGVGFERM